jgi:hypothetical protein
LFTALIAASSCLVDWTDREGTATVAWSIGGRQDPESCRARGAAFVHVRVRAENDEDAVDELVACAAFQTKILVSRGWYSGTLTLVDAARMPVATTRETGAFYVAPRYVPPRADTFVTVDFPDVTPGR